LGSRTPNKVKTTSIKLQTPLIIKKNKDLSMIENKIKKQVSRNLPEQNVYATGIRHLCVPRKLWDSFPVNPNTFEFYDSGLKYNEKALKTYKFAKIDDDYETVQRKMARYCTCGGLAAKMLDGIDPEYCKDVQIYNQCPIAKMMCIKRVLNQKSLPIPQLAHDLLQYYKDNFHHKFMEAAELYLHLTPFEVVNSIKSYAKQLEVLPYIHKSVTHQLYNLAGRYKQHNKQELQAILDKVRQITNPEPFSKFLTLLFEKPLRLMMYHVFGHQYAVGLSNKEKAKEIENMLKKKYNFTLDCSGFDQSHNGYFRQPWDLLITDIAKKYGNRFSEIVDPSIFIQEFSKNKSKITYSFTIDGKIVDYCKLNIGPRLGSGSVYTTVINTFLMLLMIKFALSKIDGNDEETVSGDDALGCSNLNIEKIADGLYHVFGWKSNNFFNNMGVQLKYCYISPDLRDAIPCSLDTFRCPRCGIKLVRHFFKYIRDTFISINYQKKFEQLGITQQEFEQLIYTGESAWFKGLDFPTIVFSPLNHNISIDQVANHIQQILKGRTQARLNLFSEYTTKLQMLNQLLEEKIDESEKALKLINLVSGETYLKARKIENCRECNSAYEAFLYRNYNITSATIIAFYRFPNRKTILYDGEVREISGNYIPASILEKCKEHYENLRNRTNYSPKENTKRQLLNDIINEYYLDRIKKFPADIFTTKPDTIQGRIDEIIDNWLVLSKQNEPFFYAMSDFLKFKSLLLTFYDVDYIQKDEVYNLDLSRVYEIDFAQPIYEEELFKKGNNYMKFKIMGIRNNLPTEYIFKLPDPSYKKPKPIFIKPKHKITFDEFRNFIQVKKGNDVDLVKEVIAGKPIPGDIGPLIPIFHRNYYRPEIDKLIPPAYPDTIVQTKTYMIELKRLIDDVPNPPGILVRLYKKMIDRLEKQLNSGLC
jgi:hypothetical protein